jgi:hypothetical protein
MSWLTVAKYLCGSSLMDVSGALVARSLVVCVLFCRSLFVSFLSVIVCISFIFTLHFKYNASTSQYDLKYIFSEHYGNNVENA